MEKIYRYMSYDEAIKLLKGEVLEHDCRKFEATTDSVGFCFLPEENHFRSRSGVVYNFSAEDCYEFLSGIVTASVLMEFAVTKEAEQKLHKGYGVYADPDAGWFSRIKIMEYSIPSYQKELLIPLRIMDFEHGKDWEEIPDHLYTQEMVEKLEEIVEEIMAEEYECPEIE